MKRIAIVGCGSTGLEAAKSILKEKVKDFEIIDTESDIMPMPPELETFEITNPYKDFGGLGMYENKPSKNQLNKCRNGLHLYNQKEECVRCGKKLNL